MQAPPATAAFLAAEAPEFIALREPPPDGYQHIVAQRLSAGQRMVLPGLRTFRRTSGVSRHTGATRTVHPFAVLVLLIVQFAAVGDASPGHACDLLTLADVQGVLGSGFTAHPASESLCAYSRGQGNDETDVVIAVSSIPPQITSDSATWLKMQQANIRGRGGTVTVTPISGLGGGAFYFLDSGKKPPVFQLHFGKGDREVVLDVETGRQPNIDAAQTLAKIAYARLR